MNFCNLCGATVSQQTPSGDSRLRDICTACGTIHYENPKLIIGSIPETKDGRILLCRRAIEPRLGLWTLPAGFMENGETTSEAAARETQEEANARIEVGELFALINIPYINQVHFFYRAHLPNEQYSAGEESLEVALFSEETIPWKELAFRSITYCLRAYFKDRANGNYSLHCTDFLAPPTAT
jgi:ADP-ribose pyrophosphatase YjhB (NUDIX family)